MNEITASDVHIVAITGRPHGTLTRDDLIAMTDPEDWINDWEDLTDGAAYMVAADLSERGTDA